MPKPCTGGGGKIAINASVKGGHAIMEVYASDFEVEHKDDKSPLTLADKNCNEVFEELNSREFLDIMTKITGINNIFLDPTLDGGGLHQVFSGGLLNIHTDFNTHLMEKTWRRVLNIIIFLNS